LSSILDPVVHDQGSVRPDAAYAQARSARGLDGAA
jgi:hypothetical protein